MSHISRFTGTSLPGVVVNNRKTKRPIDKQLIVVQQVPNTTQDTTVLYTTTFPCTMTGLRWNVSSIGNVTGSSSIFWVVVVVRDGMTIPTLATSDAATLFHPEQDVLTFGVGRMADSDSGTGNAIANWDGDTKTMRKLQGGDRLIFISVSTQGTVTLDGIIQFFLKG